MEWHGFQKSLYSGFIELKFEFKIALVLSEQVEFRHRALQIYEEVKDSPYYSHRVLPPVFRDMRDIVPLQAADIIAYEMYKEFERRTYRADSEPRFGFKRIMAMSKRYNKPPLFRFFANQDFKGLIREQEKLTKIKDYLENEIKKAS